jgi:hypothetical protein
MMQFDATQAPPCFQVEIPVAAPAMTYFVARILTRVGRPGFQECKGVGKCRSFCEAAGDLLDVTRDLMCYVC